MQVSGQLLSLMIEFVNALPATSNLRDLGLFWQKNGVKSRLITIKNRHMKLRKSNFNSF